MLSVEPFIIAFLIIFALTFAVLAKYYNEISEKELKRRAKNGDTKEQITYQIVRNKQVALLYLCVFFVGFFGWAIFLIIKNLNTFISVFLICFLLLTSLIVVQKKLFSKKIANFVSPLFLKLIIKTKPYFGGFALFIYKNLSTKTDHNIYELEDLVDLIEAQKTKKINRIDQKKLNLAVNALSFSEKNVLSIMIPKKEVRFVNSEETISTILIDELHQTGFRHFPVYKEKEVNIVGVLDLDDLVEKRMSGKVAWAIPHEVVEIAQDRNLQYILDLFLKTKQQLYIVVDENKKIKGVVNIDDVLASLLGNS